MNEERAASKGDILIVDDIPANLRLLSQTLTKNGYSVRAVTSGQRALESVRADPPNLILLDIRMPEMDGFEVCHQLKADSRTRDIPVIFISALDEVEDKVLAFEAGGVDYITKPFQVEEVLARTETHLSLRRLQKRLERANRRYQRELRLAGLVQASLLPDEMPEVSGWQLAARLKSAREMSGDFFDILRLPDGKLGLLIADVVDKGLPAALLMVMGWSLFDTYTAEHPESPEAVFAAINERLLLHLQGTQFLTAFYGILEPATGRLTYSNAGHPPPLLLAAGNGQIQELVNSGPPLGIIEENPWQAVEVSLKPNDLLVLYTDGVSEAQGADESFYGQDRLMKAIRSNTGLTAQAVCQAIISEVESFAAGVPQFDDIALLVATRISPEP